MSKIPFQIYDFTGVIFPGAFVILFAGYFYSPLIAIIPNNVTSGITFFIVGSYILGVFVQDISRSYYIKFWCMFGDFSSSNIKLNVFESLSDEQKSHTKEGLKEFYNLSEIRDIDLEPLCYSPVHDRVGQRQVFVSLADFQRSMSLLFLLSSLVLLIWFIVGFSLSFGIGKLSAIFVIFFMLIFAAYRFFRGYVTFTRYGATVVFGSFFTWWMEKKFKAKEKEKEEDAITNSAD